MNGAAIGGLTARHIRTRPATIRPASESGRTMPMVMACGKSIVTPLKASGSVYAISCARFAVSVSIIFGTTSRSMPGHTIFSKRRLSLSGVWSGVCLSPLLPHEPSSLSQVQWKRDRIHAPKSLRRFSVPFSRDTEKRNRNRLTHVLDPLVVPQVRGWRSADRESFLDDM